MNSILQFVVSIRPAVQETFTRKRTNREQIYFKLIFPLRFPLFEQDFHSRLGERGVDRPGCQARGLPKCLKSETSIILAVSATSLCLSRL